MSNRTIEIIARIMLALLFVLAGVGKLMNISGTQAYMATQGLPGILVWPTIALEIGGGVALAMGIRLREVALGLAGFTLVTAALFHHNLADQIQLTMALKNIAIAGGLLLLTRK